MLSVRHRPMVSKKLGLTYLKMRTLPSLALVLIQVCPSTLDDAKLTCIGTVPPSPSAPATSSAPTEQIITPATNPSEQLPNLNNNAAKMQYVQNQMAFFRNIQNRAAESGNPLNPQAVAQLMQAMKSGNVDMSSPGMQQIKSLLSLQQQQKSGQVAMNPGAAAALQAQAQQGSGSGGQASGTSDQLLMAAMRQQMLQQGQVNVGQQQQTQNQIQQQQQQQIQRPQTQTQTQPQGQQQNQRPNQNQIWSGNLIWTINSTTRCKPILTVRYLANVSESKPQRQCGRRKSSIRLQGRSMVQRSGHFDRYLVYYPRSSSLL